MNFMYVVKKRGDIGRGAWFVSKSVETLFPDQVSVLNVDDITDIELHRTADTVLIFPYQNMDMYKGVYNLTKQRKSDIVYVRPEDNFGWYNSCTNGFSCWKESSIKKFIPHLINVEVAKQPNDVVVGYYSRPLMTSQSYFKFVDFISKNKVKKIMLMGTDNSKHLQESLGIEVEHTYNRDKFYDSISHYYYYKSDDFVDPYPHTVEEAVKSGKQIIIEQNRRLFKDGIDDIESCIKYHTTLNDKIYNNDDSILCSNVMERYYKQLLDNNFEYDTPKFKYDTFNDWLQSI